MLSLNKSDWFFLSVVLIAAIYCAAVFLPGLTSFAVDDSFIFFRYARNLADGHGFVFNPGEPAGEGFTSWGWLLLLSVFSYLGVGLLATSKMLGLVFFLLAGIFLFKLILYITGKLREERDSRGTSILTAVLLTAGFLLNYRLLAHSVSGMETSLYIFSIVVLLYLAARAFYVEASDYKWWLWLSLCTVGLFLVRPEGIAAGGFCLLALAIRHSRALLKAKPWLYGFIGLFLPIVLFIAFKTAVFGYPLPHSYYHKLIVHGVEYGESFRHLALFFKSYWWLIVPGTLLAVHAVRVRKDYLFLFFLLFFVLMVSLYFFFYPAMNYLHRFYIPYLSLLILLVVPGVYYLVKRSGNLKYGAVRVSLLVLIFAAVIVGMNVGNKNARFRVESWSKLVNPQKTRARLGVLMNRLPRSVTVANTEMGVIPFYSGLTCIDMAGLTDPHTAHYGVSMEYLEKREVDVILFGRDTGKMSAADWDTYTQPYGKVFLSTVFKTNYEVLGRHSGYYIYADKRSPEYPQIKAWSRLLAMK
jgi:hypothetical protein